MAIGYSSFIIWIPIFLEKFNILPVSLTRFSLTVYDQLTRVTAISFNTEL